jgi:predicted Rossmann-fold nucleotide-binding protein
MGKGNDGVSGGEWGLMGKGERGVLTQHSTTVLIFM